MLLWVSEFAELLDGRTKDILRNELGADECIDTLGGAPDYPTGEKQ
jgi:hypothetical protein